MKTVFIFAIAAASIAFALEQPGVRKEAESPSQAEQAIDAQLKRYAGSDNVEGARSAFQNHILSRGQEAIPILEGLFDKNDDGMYRALHRRGQCEFFDRRLLARQAMANSNRLLRVMAAPRRLLHSNAPPSDSNLTSTQFMGWPNLSGFLA